MRDALVSGGGTVFNDMAELIDCVTHCLDPSGAASVSRSESGRAYAEMTHGDPTLFVDDMRRVLSESGPT